MDLGSMGQKGSRRRPIVEQLQSLDVRELRRRGAIGPGQPTVVVSHQTGPATVRLTWLECEFGGSRPLFNCPCCDRPAYKLYDRRGIACRRCHCLGYAVENMTEHARQLEKAFKIRERLGQTEGGIVASFPCRPKGRHWHTYFRERRRGQAIERNLWAMVARRVSLRQRRPC